ncbi:hypothetical protein LIER_27324 [Lithospermum erythrorhizon]|uniref:Bifunctional inhibitor/plant lipid transfer protein/seed storage helical domain-containing protein n=1 Tax=Lithospermum erythrorhizon TaxID=34254 RepID=A0AAV3REM3_LITER
MCRVLPKWLLHTLVGIWAIWSVESATLVVGMADCLSFVSDGSTLKKPQGSCCSGLKTLIKTDTDCLCQAFQNSAHFGVSFNITKAMNLPSAITNY